MPEFLESSVYHFDQFMIDIYFLDEVIRAGNPIDEDDFQGSVGNLHLVSDGYVRNARIEECLSILARSEFFTELKCQVRKWNTKDKPECWNALVNRVEQIDSQLSDSDG